MPSEFFGKNNRIPALIFFKISQNFNRSIKHEKSFIVYPIRIRGIYVIRL